MNNMKMVLGMVLIMAMALGYEYFVAYQYRTHPEWRRPGDATATQPTIESTPGAMDGAVASGPSSGPSSGPTSQTVGPWSLVTDSTAARTQTIGSTAASDGHFHMALALTPHGAAVDSVVLNEFQQDADVAEPFTFQTPLDEDQAPLHIHVHSLATLAITIDGTRLDLADSDFGLVLSTAQSAVYAITVAQNGKEAVRISKEFTLDPVSTDTASSHGYEVQVKYSLTNLSGDAYTASLDFAGPSVPKAETVRQDTEVVAAYDNDSLIRFDHQPQGYFTKSAPTKDFVVNPDNLKLLWLGASSNYFNAIVRPMEEGKLASAVATALNPEATADQRVVAIHFTTVNFNLAAGETTGLNLRVFFGPKQRPLLNSKYYGSFPMGYDDTLVMVTGWFCGLCTFPWLISLLVWILAGLHFVLRDWGLAIIALVCFVRLLLHPITKRSQVSMMGMQKMAPQMELLKKKFANDPTALQQAQTELYKSVGFTPVLGCLPMFLQMPIFIALWRSLQTTFELRQAPFLYFFGIHFTWIHDLSMPDALVKFSSPFIVPYFLWHVNGLNLLPLLMAVVTFINMKYFTPQPAATTPEQQQQQKMMLWMTLVFPLMLYSTPSGLILYYLTSTSLGIFESKRIRAHIKEREAEAAAKGTVIVDAGKLSRVTRRRQEVVPAAGAPKGWLARLQEKAEEMAREAQKQQKKKKKKL